MNDEKKQTPEEVAEEEQQKKLAEAYAKPKGLYEEQPAAYVAQDGSRVPAIGITNRLAHPPKP